MWIGVAISGFVLLGYISAAAVFMVKMSSMPKNLQEFKQDIGQDVATIKLDVHATRDDIGGIRTDMAVMNARIEADHSSINRLRDVDMSDLRKQLQAVRDRHGGGGA